MSFYKIRELKTTEKRDILNLTDYYSQITVEQNLTERKLLEVLRRTLSAVLPKFLSIDFLELISDFRNGKTPLLLLQGEFFAGSMPLLHTNEFVGTKFLLPQEVLAMIMSFLVGHSFGIQGERLEMVQRGAKIANYAEGRSVSGTAERDFHVDNPQDLNHLAEFLLFLVNNPGGIYTQFSAVLVEELEKYKVGNYSILEILTKPHFENTATLNCLQKEPRVHPVVSNFDKKFAGIILNENTTLKSNENLINMDLPNKWSELALGVLRKILKENSINMPYNIAFVSQTDQSVLHAVQEIPDYRLKEICADPENSSYLRFRELLRVYIAKYVENRNWVQEIKNLESNYVTGTNVMA